MLKIIDKVDASPWFGVNFDSGNFQTDDPYADLAKIAPYAVNAQIKAAIAPGGKNNPRTSNALSESSKTPVSRLCGAGIRRKRIAI